MNLANVRLLKRLFAERKTDAQIGEEMGLTADQVQRARLEYGLKRPPAGPPPAARERAAELARAGLPDPQIAAELGVTVRTAARLRREGGVKNLPGVRRTKPLGRRFEPRPLRAKKPIPEPDLSLIVSARKHGWSWRKIATQWKMSELRVKREIGRAMVGSHA